MFFEYNKGIDIGWGMSDYGWISGPDMVKKVNIMGSVKVRPTCNKNLRNTIHYFGLRLISENSRPFIVDEIIYAVGDYDSNNFQRFDPREGKWSFLANIPNKTSFTALSVFGHTITCSGGEGTESLCQVYDIRNDKWDELANLTNRVYGAKSIENETSIIVAGGQNCVQIQSYNKDNKTCSIMGIKLPHGNWCSSKIWL
uniref:F-box/kelch-repeat protein n=1 Tax=Rhabditophanes sp. KR3021 TaxID=114890 RepID=A0AC35U2C7_9BILA